jgi:hypothetical protein
MTYSLLLRLGCHGVSEGEFRDVDPEVPVGRRQPVAVTV